MESAGKGIYLNSKKFFHFGVVVKEIDVVISALLDLFGDGKVVRRSVNNEYLGKLIGIVNASAEIAMFETSNGEFIEILSWSDNSSSELSSITTSSTAHVCFFVDNINELWMNTLRSNFLTPISEGIITIPVGPNRGSKVFFVKINNEFYVELFQKM